MFDDTLCSHFIFKFRCQFIFLGLTGFFRHEFRVGFNDPKSRLTIYVMVLIDFVFVLYSFHCFHGIKRITREWQRRHEFHTRNYLAVKQH